MRISDWSSDVCSSDLRRGSTRCDAAWPNPGYIRPILQSRSGDTPLRRKGDGGGEERRRADALRRRLRADRRIRRIAAPGDGRSEGHTSELQSLMRISYAVFCLKKKTRRYTNILLPLHH